MVTRYEVEVSPDRETIHDVVIVVADVDRACAGHGHAHRVVKFCAGRDAAFAADARTRCSVSGDGVDRSPDRKLPDALVCVVRNGDQRARAVDRDSVRICNFRADGRRAVAGITVGVVSGNGADLVVGLGHLAHDVVIRVSDEQVARAVDRNPCGIIQLGAHGRAAISRIAAGMVSSHGADVVAGKDYLANHAVVIVADEEIA